ncbi:mariner-Tc1 transposon family protein [Penicillium malachiteum]|nr:mariner-Tc1 transposon family protein [Penicillium malachiteum]KAJ5721892.1 mariner-Tc1 transposon family protein [Penicillium malachiteum]
MSTKPRSAISVEQKKALRAYKRDNPTKSNISISNWFKSTFQRPIALSSVSEILSKRYAFLDEQHQRQLAQQRFRREHWPELEDVLFQWIQHAERHITITSATLREKAEFFWKNLPNYEDLEMPTFSNGWLQGFQQRRGIKSFKQFGELASAANAEDEMNSIRQALAGFQP